MGRYITDDEAIKATWTVQLPSLRLEMPLSGNDAFNRLRAERGDKSYADMGVWLQLCSLASSATGHALPINYDRLAQMLFKTEGKSTVTADHVKALAAAGLVDACDDGWLYIPVIETESVRHGKMIVGGTRGGRPKKKRRR